MTNKPEWATHTFKNTNGDKIWFNKETGQAKGFHMDGFVILSKDHYSQRTCKPVTPSKR